jgi:hypothetical protein
MAYEMESELEAEFEEELEDESEDEMEDEAVLEGEGWLGRIAGSLLSESEDEDEGEYEDEISPVRKVYADAMMEHLGELAAEAETEDEAAEHFLPLVGMAASKLLPVVAKAVAPLARCQYGRESASPKSPDAASASRSAWHRPAHGWQHRSQSGARRPRNTAHSGSNAGQADATGAWYAAAQGAGTSTPSSPRTKISRSRWTRRRRSQRPHPWSWARAAWYCLWRASSRLARCPSCPPSRSQSSCPRRRIGRTFWGDRWRP